MKWNHLQAILWMRWRILVNRVKRAGKLSNAFFLFVVVLVLLGSIGLFALAFILGLELRPPEAEPMDLMFLWAGLAVAFLFFWTIGLVTDLQRADAMSFKNLLHLPVSLGWIFLYNYLSSFVSVGVMIFMPAMLGLSLALVIVHGPLLLLSFPLVLGFFGMITALTYQLRGWLARLMENKRRRRNIIAAVTVGFVLLLQLPNLVNLGLSRSRRAERKRLEQIEAEVGQTAEEVGSGQALEVGPQAPPTSPEERIAEIQAEKDRKEADLDHVVSLSAMIIPVGWLPYGVRQALDGRLLQSALCALGMLTIGAWSLRRSYRKTMASIVGGGSGVESVAHPQLARAIETEAVGRKPLLVEGRLPWVSERTSAIALASLRSLWRAPEVKILLLSPVVLLGLFGFLLATNPDLDDMRAYAPLASLGAVITGLISINQLVQNQFGLDRDGFRSYVLSPVPRHQILLGKNLATAPLGLGIGLAALIGLQFFLTVDVSHFLGACLQLLSAYLILCLLGNAMSIDAPLRLKEHGLKAANAKLRTILTHLATFFLLPLLVSPLLIPYGVDCLFQWQGWLPGIPVYFLLHGAGLVAVFFFYRRTIRFQGARLQAREQRILEVLTKD